MAKTNLIGQIINPWKILEYAGQQRQECGVLQTYWKVNCTNCGLEADKTTSAIKNKHGCRNCSLLPKGAAGLNNLYTTYKGNCRRSGRQFDITLEYFKNLTSAKCHYCGSEPQKIFSCNKYRNKSSTWGNYTFNGIDRVNNDIGYTNVNCVPCCHICNRAKNIMSAAEFTDFIKRVSDNAAAGLIPCLSPTS